MPDDFNLILRMMGLLLVIDAGIIAVLFASKAYYRSRYKRTIKMADYLRRIILRSDTSPELLKKITRHPVLLFNMIRNLGDSVELPEGLQARVVTLLTKKGYIRRFISQLGSPFVVRRLRAITYLTIAGDERTGDYLLRRLQKERRWFIKLALIHSLSRLKFHSAIPTIINILHTAPHWVLQKSVAVLPAFGEELDRHISIVIRDPQRRNRELLFQLALTYQSPVIQQFLLDCIHSGHSTLTRRAAKVLEQTAPRVLVQQKLYTHSDPQVRACALRGLQSEPTSTSVDTLLDNLTGKKEQTDAAVSALQRILLKKPALIDKMLEAFSNSENITKSRNIAKVLEIRLEYLLSRINSARYQEIRQLVETLLAIRQTAVLFGYLERPHDPDVETSLLPILSHAVHQDRELSSICSKYLPEEIAAKMKIEKTEPVVQAEKVPLGKGDRRLLLTFLGLIIGTGPLLYIAGNFETVMKLSFIEHIKNFTLAYNFFFIFYSFIINSIYLLLLVAALFYLVKQLRYWNIHSLRFLFAPDLLPSISILAPAYNEELNITDNVKSLLNLHYPDVEVIVINDGSADRTLERLIEDFSLERSDKNFRASIRTEPIRGVYTSPSYPNLTVVDKSNGGKADSLNAGINLAGKDFICTIDSDSLLEDDALLKIAYQSLLTDREPAAMGGNILPANGCKVRNGRLVSIQLGRKHLVRFQTIEYMRSFLAGRLGWSFFNSMVIISGAFGLFLRRRVIEIGGYLTPRSRMHASTVGEDMEMVVRLHRHLRKKRVPYRVFDAFNANCWTEVPETFKILHRQRDRWHRGLIESLLRHKHMLGNPRFGPVGLLAFPYFFLFELIGPFLELYGYVNIAISLSLGLINGPTALLLFTAVILYGMLISIASLLISEHEVLYFSIRETFLIVLYGILENFGFRQIMSMIRVTAYVEFIFKEKSWGAMDRRGLGS